MTEGNHQDKGGYRYSYSGADCKVWGYRGDQEKAIFLESVQTISFSIHEPRGRARALGHKAVKGFSRSVREIAGTMIFTVIEDHPLAKLMTKESGGSYSSGWSVDAVSKGVGTLYGSVNSRKSISENRIATTMPAFNLMLVYATEVIAEPEVILTTTAANNTGVAPDLDSTSKFRSQGSAGAIQDRFNYDGDVLSKRGVPTADELGYGIERRDFTSTRTQFENSYSVTAEQKDSFKVNVAGLVLEGIEIITEGIVTSVNDMITEIQVQFIAKDYKEFSLSQYESLQDSDIDFSLLYERMKESYQDHADWDRFEQDLLIYELDFDHGGGRYAKLNEFNSETNYSPLIWDDEEGIYTVHSQTNLNPTLSFDTDKLKKDLDEFSLLRGPGF